MLDYKELRIGNIILSPDTNKPVRVEIDHLRAIKNNASINGVFYEPIPLTPEILEKAGFENELNQFFTSTKAVREGFIELEKDGDLYIVMLKQKNEDETWDSVLLNDIFYLHQIQNLFFALTNEELEINL
jgi:predicted nicotinamide N-methyase